jgi:hypothetical protein
MVFLRAKIHHFCEKRIVLPLFSEKAHIIYLIRKPLPVLEEAFFLWILEAADNAKGVQGRSVD